MTHQLFHKCGEEFLLHTERVILWPRTNSLIAADLHFGKDAWFRRQGIAVPSGNTDLDLHRLSLLIEAYSVRRLILLGDIFHQRLSETEPFHQAFDSWRQRHPQVKIIGIIGNHDRHGALTLFSDIIQWCAHWQEGPFLFSHEPIEHEQHYVLAGHLHPVIHLRAASDRISAPVFWFRKHYGVLPSFGSLTGGHPIRPDKNDNVFIVGPTQVTLL